MHFNGIGSYKSPCGHFNGISAKKTYVINDLTTWDLEQMRDNSIKKIYVLHNKVCLENEITQSGFTIKKIWSIENS